MEAAHALACGWNASIDRLFRETDRLYYTIAKGCGLSECAYWVMYAIKEAEGRTTLRQVCERWSYSKQTVNSAVKRLEGRGLVTLEFEPGSRKNKMVLLTAAGRKLCEEKIGPAMEAERRAFGSLEPEEREALLRLVEKYTRAIDLETKRAAQAGEPGTPVAGNEQRLDVSAPSRSAEEQLVTQGKESV